MATYNGHQEDSSGNVLLPIPNSMATTIETGSTASQAYTKGSYFYYNNRLVKASSAIASGATLTIGSNIAYVNAADELSAHLRANDSSRSEFYFDVKDGNYGYYPSAAKTPSTFVPFGGTSETLLWSSDLNTFPATNVTLPDMTTYTYIKFVYQNTSALTDTSSVIYPVSDILKWWTGNNTGTGSNVVDGCLGGVHRSNAGTWSRALFYNGVNVINIGTCYRLGSAQSDNTFVLPRQIYGIK